MGTIFRVQRRYGIQDYHNLAQAKEHSTEGDTIQLVDADGLTILGETKRNYATPSWVWKVLKRHGWVHCAFLQ